MEDGFLPLAKGDSGTIGGHGFSLASTQDIFLIPNFFYRLDGAGVFRYSRRNNLIKS